MFSFFYCYFWNLFMQSMTLAVASRTSVKGLPKGIFGHKAAECSKHQAQWDVSMEVKYKGHCQYCLYPIDPILSL